MTLPFTPPQGPLSDESHEKDELDNVDTEDLPEIFEQRRLENDGDYSSIYVDKNGNEYEPYSMGWRYLGMYVDCETSDYRRNLGSGSGDGDAECSRKLLWAAYVDPKYEGGSIGEYQFYDPYTNTWDDSSCQTSRCAKMDCHDPHTHFKLIGVFKETDGLYDWGEQLFKHHGYCQWDEDTYDVMQEMIENWPQDGCKELGYPDMNGNTLYKATKPLAEGNLTIGLYYNNDCTQDSGMLWSDYILIYYNTKYSNSYYYYNYAQQGKTEAQEWDANNIIWNNAMATYKLCQPCRAYDLNQDESGSGSRDRELDENDGEGDAEQWGYDCYDDEGYTNCNQCYKFQTKTDLEPAEREDLKLASRQGTILEIRVNHMSYGKGGFRSPTLYASEYVTYTIAAVLGISMLAALVYKCRYWYKNRQKALDYFDDVDPGTTSCALVGLECKVSLAQQQPTATDPMGVDFCRFPRLVKNKKNADEQANSKAKMPRSKKSKDWNDGLTEMGSSSEEEEDCEKEKKPVPVLPRSEENDNTEKKSASPLSWLFSKKSKNDTAKKKDDVGLEMGYMAFPPETNLTNKEESDATRLGYCHPPEIVRKTEEEPGSEQTTPASETNSTIKKEEPGLDKNA